MLGFTGRASSTEITVDEVEVAEARWFTRTELREEVEAGRVVLPGGDLDQPRAHRAVVRREAARVLVRGPGGGWWGRADAEVRRRARRASP